MSQAIKTEPGDDDPSGGINAALLEELIRVLKEVRAERPNGPPPGFSNVPPGEERPPSPRKRGYEPVAPSSSSSTATTRGSLGPPEFVVTPYQSRPTTPAWNLPGPVAREKEILAFFTPELNFITAVAALSNRSAKALCNIVKLVDNVTALRRTFVPLEGEVDDETAEIRRWAQEMALVVQGQLADGYRHRLGYPAGDPEGLSILINTPLLAACEAARLALASLLERDDIMRWPMRAFISEYHTRHAFAQLVAYELQLNNTLVPTQPQFRDSFRRVQRSKLAQQAAFVRCDLRDGMVKLASRNGDQYQGGIRTESGIVDSQLFPERHFV